VRPEGSRGGQANEAGSLYRSGVAAYLAAYGLAGRGMEAADYPAGGTAPVRLEFETAQAVDDIRCGMSDGTVLDLQAKRVCGVDANLRATVGQWAAQTDRLGPGDKIGLATAEPKDAVRDLPSALARRRRAVPGVVPRRESAALAAVEACIPSSLSREAVERMLNAAVVMVVAASGPADEGFRSAANLLEGVVVAPGSGTRAMGVLQHSFQEQASAGAGSGLDDWLQILASAGIEVFSDAGGAPGPRRRAELDAVAGHRARLASRDGILEYSLLADDLPPMRIAWLADSLRVTVPGEERPEPEDFLIMARRWPRMLLTGLPGMGKSTALEQAAARWAADADAPVPVLVQLPDLVRGDPRRGSDITLSVLIEAATVTAPEDERQPLRSALERAADAGELVLLLDGLDECQDRRAVVADGIAATALGLPAGTGIVLATRDSGLAAARRLNLPQARLTEPSWLGAALAQLLRHAADSRGRPDAERDQWVRDRQEQVAEICARHPELWRVPLLATLLTLLAAGRAPGTLPATRARLMAEAVQDTVSRWELSRPQRDMPGMRGEQLIDGYGEIAHAIMSGQSNCPADVVRQRVADMLAVRWANAPAEALARARDVISFWDDRVGVFIASAPDGDIGPRSRVFAETGDAMWAAAQEPETRRAWLTAALTDDNHREAVILAAGLAPDVIPGLIESAAQENDPTVGSRALTWATDAAADSPETDTATIRALIRELARAPRDPGPSPEADGEAAAVHVPAPGSTPTPPNWAHVVRILLLQLPADLRPERDRVLSELTLDDDHQVIASALAALADARADSIDSLEPDQEAAVRRLLAIPLPERRPPARDMSPGQDQAVPAARPRQLVPGHSQAAEQAASYAAQLGPDAADAIYRIVRRGSAGTYFRVRAQLAALGYQDPERPRVNLPLPPSTLAFDTDPWWDQWEVFLRAAASTAPTRALTHAERWRYPDVMALADVLDPGNATLTGIDDALTTDEALLPGWIRAVSHAAGLDLPGIVAQAEAALQSWPSGNRDIIHLMLATRSTSAPVSESARLDAEDVSSLIAALGAASEWLAETAYTILLPAGHPEASRQLAARLSTMPAARHKNAAIIVIANDSSPPVAAVRLLDIGDPETRAGVAAAAALLAPHGDAGSWNPVLTRIRDDQIVPQAAGGHAPAGATER
jgi:hypothetical protein